MRRFLGCACEHSGGCGSGPISGKELPPVDHKHFQTTDSGATTGMQDKVPGGWVVVAAGRHSGWEYSFDAKEWVPIVPNQPIKTFPNGIIYWRAPSGSGGILRREAWEPRLWELVGEIQTSVVAAAPKSANDPTGANPPQRVALTTGAATLISFAADTVKAVLKGKAGNAAMAYVATTAANILVATTRFEISQDFVIDVYPGTTVYVTGTTGDHIDVWEYEGT